jgi:RAB protein geranylgeranyltransferase component A
MEKFVNVLSSLEIQLISKIMTKRLQKEKLLELFVLWITQFQTPMTAKLVKLSFLKNKQKEKTVCFLFFDLISQDIYVCCISDAHYVCAKGKYLAIVATTVETDKPEAEIKVALDLLGKIEKIFYSVSVVYEPKTDGKKDNLFISSSVDASTHFETTAQNALDLYERITGTKFDLNKSKEERDKEMGVSQEQGL